MADAMLEVIQKERATDYGIEVYLLQRYMEFKFAIESGSLSKVEETRNNMYKDISLNDVHVKMYQTTPPPRDLLSLCVDNKQDKIGKYLLSQGIDWDIQVSSNFFLIFFISAQDKVLFVYSGAPNRVLIVNPGALDRVLFVNSGAPHRVLFVNSGAPDKVLFVDSGALDRVLFVNSGTPDRVSLYQCKKSSMQNNTVNTIFRGCRWYQEATKCRDQQNTHVSGKVIGKYQNHEFRCQLTAYYQFIHEN